MNQISDTFNGLMKEISERRSVRRYTDAPVDDQLLNRLLEVAGHTQTMGNLQQPASGRRFRNRKDLYCRRTCP